MSHKFCKQKIYFFVYGNYSTKPFAIEKDVDNGTFEAVVKDREGNTIRILGGGNLPVGEHEAMIKQRDEKEMVRVREKLGVVDEEEERKILPSKRENLPPLKEGFMRIVHITDPNTAQKIADSGLNYELQGMISSTARAFSKAEEVVLENEDRRFSFPGARAVIIDIPINEFRIHNDPTKSPGIVPAEYIVGICNVNPNAPDDKIFTHGI